MNPFSISLVPAPCMPCCSSNPPFVCNCVLAIPPGAAPFPDYTTAAAQIAGYVSGCVGWLAGSPAVSSFVASFSGTDLDLNCTLSSGSGFTMWASISTLAGATLTFAYDPPFTGVFNGVCYACDGSVISTSDGTSDTWVISIPADGQYILKFVCTSGPSLHVSSSCDMTIVANPVAAQWDDSGTTRQLLACPRFFFPPGTESSGTWYANQTAALAAITAAEVSNCLGLILTDAVYTFTATNGGTSLTLDGNVTGGVGVGAGFSMFGSISVANGASIAIAWTMSSAAASRLANYTIYDQSGSVVQTDSSVVDSGTFHPAALPAGSYLILVQVANSGPPNGIAGTFTISGILKPNPIQALYDVGLSCPARLDC